MTYSVSEILQGLASVLSELKYPIYGSRRQQGVKVPCFFISIMPSTSTTELDRRFMNELGIDIVFLQQENTINDSDEMYRIWDFLNQNLEFIPYTVGEESVLIHTYDRHMFVQDADMHYQLTIKNRVSLPTDAAKMASLEEINYEIKVKQQS